jgi:NAD(P)-dependent dehydrogenase (short-subunit alcohol dehydrogenase family)
MLLEEKNAVIYGGGGAIGTAVARAFASEGANVFLAGRTLASVEAVAKEISLAGGAAHASSVDALDERAVAELLDAVAERGGSVDVSFNATGIGWDLGAPVVDMTTDDFVVPIADGMRKHVVTATAAARHMIRQRSGVILTITATPARKPIPLVGNFGVGCAAIEALCRQLALELGPYGIRVVCMRSAGSSDSPGVDRVNQFMAEKAGMSREAFEVARVESTLLKRLPKLAEVASAAVLMASDRASAITGAVANVTCGEIVD